MRSCCDETLPKSTGWGLDTFTIDLVTQAMFTLYRIVKRSIAETVPDKASVHTRIATFGTISALEQDYVAPFSKDIIPSMQRSSCSCSHCTE